MRACGKVIATLRAMPQDATVACAHEGSAAYMRALAHDIDRNDLRVVVSNTHSSKNALLRAIARLEARFGADPDTGENT